MSETENQSLIGFYAWISTAGHSYTEEALNSVCLPSSAEKFEAKELLFQFTSESIAQRRGKVKAKKKKNNRILELFIKMTMNATIPSFVADSNKSMPPASGCEVLDEHIVYFTSEIDL